MKKAAMKRKIKQLHKPSRRREAKNHSSERTRQTAHVSDSGGRAAIAMRCTALINSMGRKVCCCVEPDVESQCANVISLTVRHFFFSSPER